MNQKNSEQPMSEEEQYVFASETLRDAVAKCRDGMIDPAVLMITMLDFVVDGAMALAVYSNVVRTDGVLVTPKEIIMPILDECLEGSKDRQAEMMAQCDAFVSSRKAAA